MIPLLYRLMMAFPSRDARRDYATWYRQQSERLQEQVDGLAEQLAYERRRADALHERYIRALTQAQVLERQVSFGYLDGRPGVVIVQHSPSQGTAVIDTEGTTA